MKNIKFETENGFTQYYVFYDEFGEYRGTIDKDKVSSLKGNQWIKGVSCFVVNENNEVLIANRKAGGLASGKTDLCSGYIENRDIKTRAIVKVLNEDFGINIHNDIYALKSVLGNDTIPLSIESNGIEVNCLTSFFFLKKPADQININRNKIEMLKWVQMEECFELIRSGKLVFPRDETIYEQVFEKVRELSLGIKDEKSMIH